MSRQSGYTILQLPTSSLSRPTTLNTRELGHRIGEGPSPLHRSDLNLTEQLDGEQKDESNQQEGYERLQKGEAARL